MDFLPDGRMVLTTTGDVSSGGWVPNPESGEVYVLDNVTGTTTKAQVTYTQGRRQAEEPDGHPGHRRPLVRLRARGPHRAARPTPTRRRPDGSQAPRFVAQRRQLPRVRLRPHPRRRLLLRRPLERHQQRRRDDRPAAGRRSGHRDQDQPQHVAGLDRSPVACARRTASASGPRTGSSSTTTRVPGCRRTRWSRSSRTASSTTSPTRPARSTPSRSRSPSCGCRTTRSPTPRRTRSCSTTVRSRARCSGATSPTAACSAASSRRSSGEFQGAVFRHSAGLEVGVNRTIIGPDGAIYVGGTGEGGNWGEDNKLRYGLQKLTPNGKNVFDMAKMEVDRGRLQDQLHAAGR